MMKKIVPFNNVLQFNTDVREITAISLEHEINKSPDMISGVFYISGEYKITDGQLDKEKFNFELPFDIALSSNYRSDSLLVDIDDFRYDLISDKDLKVNIDLYIDGEVEEPLPRDTRREILEFPEDNYQETTNLDIEEQLDRKANLDREEEPEEIAELQDLLMDEPFSESQNMDTNQEDICEETNQDEPIEPERIDLLKEMLTTNKEEDMMEDINLNINNTNDNDSQNINNNILEPTKEETYVTYRVYKVMEGDTLDTILTKYNITKESLADYNNIENINPGDKLIIPTTNEK